MGKRLGRLGKGRRLGCREEGRLAETSRPAGAGRPAETGSLGEEGRPAEEGSLGEAGRPAETSRPVGAGSLEVESCSGSLGEEGCSD